MRKRASYGLVSALERAERKAVRVHKASSKGVKKSREELLSSIFGTPSTKEVSKPSKTKVQVSQENMEKYALIQQSFFNIFDESTQTWYHGRFSKVENAQKNKKVDADSTVNIYDFKSRKYVDICLKNVSVIKAKGEEVSF